MSIEAVIQMAMEKGIALSLVDGRLKYAGRREAVNELLEPLRQHKAELICWLQSANDRSHACTRANWNVSLPPGGTSEATLDKFWTASLALDASIVAAGGSLSLPVEPTNPTVVSTTLAAAQPEAKRLFRQRGPWLTDPESIAAKEYHAHHFNCPTCIAAGRGSRYGQRCGAGMALWSGYQVGESSTSKG